MSRAANALGHRANHLLLTAAQRKAQDPHKPLSRPDGSNPDGFYRQVAEAYRDVLQTTPKVAKALAEEADVPVGTVHRWVMESRRRGFLPPGPPGARRMSRRRSDGEGSIYRRASDGLWVASLTYADDTGERRQRVVASGKRRGVVAEKLEEARRRLKADEPVKDARLTVAMSSTTGHERHYRPRAGGQPQSRTTGSSP